MGAELSSPGPTLESGPEAMKMRASAGSNIGALIIRTGYIILQFRNPQNLILTVKAPSLGAP